MNIIEWLNRSFGGNWYLSTPNKWRDSRNVGREALLIGSAIRVTEIKDLKS